MDIGERKVAMAFRGRLEAPTAQLTWLDSEVLALRWHHAGWPLESGSAFEGYGDAWHLVGKDIR